MMQVECMGVQLPPLKARLVKIVKASGDLGASWQDIYGSLYAGFPRTQTEMRWDDAGHCYRRRESPGRNTIKSHIWQINEHLELEGASWRLVSEGRGIHARWRLQQGAKKSPGARPGDGDL